MRSLIQRLALAAVVAAAGISACGAGETRYSRQRAQQTLTRLDAAGLVLGEFTLTKVVDGDTVHVDGLASSLRLVGLDAEETFKTERDRRDVADWPAYLASRRAGGLRPVKMATPMGEEAKQFAKHFFGAGARVRLERDDPDEIRDRYGRYLAYVFVEKDGRWVNYNVECVRAGMSPYFSKYGWSKRFHAELAAAEREARAARRGIWDPSRQAYPDYDERKAWWDARAAFVAAFERDAADRRDHVVLSHWDALRRLEERVGQEVAVLATVDDVRRGDRGPTRVLLARRMFADLPVVFFDKDVLAASGIAAWKGEFVVVRGVVSLYEHRRSHQKELQIVVDRPGQIALSPVPGLRLPAAEVAP